MNNLQYSGDDDQQKQKLSENAYINVLIFGDEGVGKSTFINSLANYFKYGSFENAYNSQTICLVPTQFHIAAQNFENSTVVDTKFCPGEFAESGWNFKGLKSYIFHTENEKPSIRFIKTPSRYEMTNSNEEPASFKIVFEFLREYKDLHGICILLKPNQSRLANNVERCLQTLFDLLAVQRINNVMFVFTSARTTFYRPAETKPILDRMLKILKNRNPDANIVIDKNNMFHLDNEAYPLLIALKHNVKIAKGEQELYIKSWEKSSQEGHRLLNYIMDTSKSSETKVKSPQPSTVPVEEESIEDVLDESDQRKLCIVYPLIDILNLLDQDMKKLTEYLDPRDETKWSVNDNRISCANNEILLIKFKYDLQECENSKHRIAKTLIHILETLPSDQKSFKKYAMNLRLTLNEVDIPGTSNDIRKLYSLKEIGGTIQNMHEKQIHICNEITSTEYSRALQLSLNTLEVEYGKKKSENQGTPKRTSTTSNLRWSNSNRPNSPVENKTNCTIL